MDYRVLSGTLNFTITNYRLTEIHYIVKLHQNLVSSFQVVGSFRVEKVKGQGQVSLKFNHFCGLL